MLAKAKTGTGKTVAFLVHSLKTLTCTCVPVAFESVSNRH